MLIADFWTLLEASHRQMMRDPTMFEASLQTDRQSTEDTGRMIIEETSTGVIAHSIKEMSSLLQDGTTGPIGALVNLIPTQT
jgi:hypothetical protein